MTTTLEHPPVKQEPQTQVALGVLDIDAGGKGHLRAADSLLATPSDLPSPPR